MSENQNQNRFHRMDIKQYIFIILLLFPAAYPQRNSIDHSDTLAVIGNKVITINEFQKYYKDKLLRIGITDNGDTRVKYLLNLIDDELLIVDAKNKELDKSKSSVNEYARIVTQELLNAFSKSFIESTVNVTEQDIKNMYIKMNTKIKVRHLYARSKEEAEKLYVQLKKGEKFEELAKEVFHDEKLRDNNGDLGYISVDDMDPDFENAAYSMKIGEISHPVKTVTGYSIIKVEDIKQNPFVLESEYLKAHDRIKTFVVKRFYEDAAKRYTVHKKNELEIKFNKSLLNKLYESLPSVSNKSELENSTSFYQQNKNNVIVKSKIENWNLTKLISEMQITNEEQRKWIHSANDLEDFISGLIIRKETIRKAVEAGLDDSQSFKNNVDFNFNTFLMKQVELGLREKIIISSDSIKTYYEQNSDRFRKEAEIRLSSILVNNSALADSVIGLLNNGIPFEKVAGELSMQTITAKNKGDMGFFRRSELGNLGDRVFALSPGQWTGPVSEDGKYLFLKCSDFKLPVMRSLSEVRKDIEQTLTTLNWSKLRKAYVNSLTEEIRVQVFPEKLNTINLLTKADIR